MTKIKINWNQLQYRILLSGKMSLTKLTNQCLERRHEGKLLDIALWRTNSQNIQDKKKEDSDRWRKR